MSIKSYHPKIISSTAGLGFVEVQSGVRFSSQDVASIGGWRSRMQNIASGPAKPTIPLKERNRSGVFTDSEGYGSGTLVDHGGIVGIRQRNRKVPLRRCVVLVLGLDPDGVGRVVGLIIESGRGLVRTNRIEREEGIVSIPGTAHQVIGQGGVGIRIGGIEFTNHRADWLVLGEGEWSGGIEVGGGVVGLFQGMQRLNLGCVEGPVIDPYVFEVHFGVIALTNATSNIEVILALAKNR